MRSAIGIFGALCGLVVVALVARYGFRTADNEVDGYMAAFLFGMIATGAIFGHTIAVRLWRYNKAASIFFGLICCSALVINLSNSLGAIAGRGDGAQAQRVKLTDELRDLRRSIARAESERAAMRFVPVDDATVTAAKRASEVAGASREAECSKRGVECRKREEAEGKALTDLREATANKAATDSAQKLDAEIVRLKDRIGKTAPVGSINPHGSMLARLLQLPDTAAEWVETWQSFVMAVVVELLIIGCLVAFEIMGHSPESAVRQVTHVQVVEPEPLPQPMSSQLKPRLVAARNDPPGGAVAPIMMEVLEPAKGRRVELGEAYKSYAAMCKLTGSEPVTPNQFLDVMARFCKTAKIKTKIDREKLFLMDVQLVENSHRSISS